ncbi:class I adenylate-forming enzyme family protein [Gilliamella intestini]|uniref:Acyl-CoA synthetase (AMP-forming)/AMP-acid ligase II n=1 Tax=Gilliamella intestini TaxID=1798183 RepID=A0A1C4AVI7_9GAMM|nr:AMP-binding protein [Gilliamella intestini]SCB98591.1 Acyl-CoA synthetase (AMP-forming)/AMP-acid ligase II [Gilliamella intestini]
MIKSILALYKTQLLTFKGIGYLFTSIRLVGMNLMALLYIRQRLCPEQIAISQEGVCINYRTLYCQSQHLAMQLALHCGIKPHQKVAIMANNHAILVHTLFAVARLGADIYLLNTELSAAQVNDISNNVKFDCVIYDPDVTALPPIKNSLPTYHESQTSVYSLLTALPLAHQTKIKVTHFAKVTVLTSGTTGRFKMAGRSSKAQNFMRPFLQLLVKLKLSHYKKIYIATPIYHGFGIATLCMSVLLGATMFLTRRFEAKKSCQLIVDNQIEVVTLVPLMLNRMLTYSVDQLKSLSCIITGGAPITAMLVKQTLDQLGKVLFNLYGTSEAGVCMIATPDDLAIKPTTIGRPLKGLCAKLVAKEDKKELYIKCAWSTLGNRWVATGDLADKDAEGFYYLKGRVDDMIVSGGENVYPFELEQHLLSHLEIKDTAVISVPDTEFGQRLVAFVVLVPNSKLTETVLLGWLKSQIARYQMPKKINIIDQLPMTKIGKVDRKRLTQLYLSC